MENLKSLKLPAPLSFALRWLLLGAILGAVVGTACAGFLWLLDFVTQLRFAHSWLLYLLPVGGAFSAWLYAHFGAQSESGNNLLLDAIHSTHTRDNKSDGSIIVPRRMAPLILISTLITHLFGGSAGREGTALQMGGSLASTLARTLKLSPEDTRLLLMAGVAAGFGGVFGTPLAGTIFALEVLFIGQMRYDALWPCFVGAVGGDYVSRAWGTGHGVYHVAVLPNSAGFSPLLAFKVALASVAFGVVSAGFAKLTHFLSREWKRRVSSPLLRPMLGGVAVVLGALLLGRDYLGLSVSSPQTGAVSLQTCFVVGGVGVLSWWWKLLFTSVTLASGFKGGEVTPLFFIGAALGNVLGTWLGAPVDLFAALGLVAILAGATNTPLACTILGIELFGSHDAVYFALACVVAYGCSGHAGIYASQRVGVRKWDASEL